MGGGGIYFGGDRPLAAHKPSILKIDVFMDDRLGLSSADRRRLRPCVAFAIEHIVRSFKPFFSHPADKLRAAICYLEAREPRLAA